MRRASRLYASQYLFALAGVIFAGAVFNPNYTSRHSFYLRKLTPVFFGVIGFQWGRT